MLNEQTKTNKSNQHVNSDLPPATFDGSPEKKPVVKLSSEQGVVIRETINALANDCRVFQRAEQLVHVVRELKPTKRKGISRPAGTPSIRETSKGFLREAVCDQTTFLSYVENARDWKRKPPAD